MREIKFRVYCKEENKFYYATLEEICNNIGFEYGIPDNVLAFAKDGIEKPKTKYTGLKDKNGAEIYEGDIVSCFLDGFDEVSEVFFDEGAFSIHAKNNDPDYRPCLFEVTDLKVIGNIYQNNELLK